MNRHVYAHSQPDKPFRGMTRVDFVFFSDTPKGFRMHQIDEDLIENPDSFSLEEAMQSWITIDSDRMTEIQQEPTIALITEGGDLVVTGSVVVETGWNRSDGRMYPITYRTIPK